MKSERQPLFGGTPSSWGGLHTGIGTASTGRETCTEGESMTAAFPRPGGFMRRRHDGARCLSTGAGEERRKEQFLRKA